MDRRLLDMEHVRSGGVSRRRFGVALAALSGGVAAFGGKLVTSVGAAGSTATQRSLLDLVPFLADAAPFDSAGRRHLAADLLTYFVRQQGLFPGRKVFLLPAAPWFGGHEPIASKRAWDMTVPAGQPLYLLANADPSGKIDPSLTTVTVNGAEIPALADHVHTGVSALHAGQVRDHAVLDLVFEPPAPGRYHIEVKSRRPRDGETSYDDTTLVYDLTVQPSDALGTLLLRDPAGHVYAIHGSERRHVPDPETLQALGFSAGHAAPASTSLIESLLEGAPLPKLRDGMLVRADNHSAVFRLHGGKRVWQRSYSPDSGDYGGAEEVITIESAVLGAIVPVLQNDILLKGTAADVYHVDRGALRKVPDWKWVTERRLNPADTFFVPDRIIATLPQTSPHWVMPGGAWQDQAFHSQTLGREMPYRVYLPPEYAAADRAGQRYPVLYLLHGMGGRYDEWSGYGVEEVANQLLSDGRFAHTIIVMPQGGLGYWMEQEGGTNWGDYVARDVVGHVDATYRTFARREARAIGGLSMGAHGALQLSLNYSDVFGIAGAHSPSIRTADSAPAFMGKGGGFARRDPISLVENAQIANPPRIWIDTGTNDSWRPSAEAIHQALVDRGWAHEWHVYPGEHDGWYWGDHIWDYLPYYADAFAKNGIPLLRGGLRNP